MASPKGSSGQSVVTMATPQALARGPWVPSRKGLSHKDSLTPCLPLFLPMFTKYRWGAYSVLD